MTDADGNHGPYGKRMMSLFPAHHGFLNGDQFMNVEKKPRKKNKAVGGFRYNIIAALAGNALAGNALAGVQEPTNIWDITF